MGWWVWGVFGGGEGGGVGVGWGFEVEPLSPACEHHGAGSQHGANGDQHRRRLVARAASALFLCCFVSPFFPFVFVFFWAALRSPAKSLTLSGLNGNYH